MCNFSDSATAVMLAARQHAAARGCGSVDVHDIFHALIADPDSSASRIFNELGVEHARLLESFGNRMQTHWSPLARGEERPPAELLPFSPHVIHMLYQAESMSREFPTHFIEPEHLLVAALQHPKGRSFLRTFRLFVHQVHSQVRKSSKAVAHSSDSPQP